MPLLIAANPGFAVLAISGGHVVASPVIAWQFVDDLTVVPVTVCGPADGPSFVWPCPTDGPVIEQPDGSVVQPCCGIGWADRHDWGSDVAAARAAHVSLFNFWSDRAERDAA